MARKSRIYGSNSKTVAVTINPKIVAFVCNWQSQNKKKPEDYTTKSYSADVKFLRVMCASRVDRAVLLKCVQEKVDGIFIGMCNSENCHFRGGIDLAKNRFQNTIDFLDIIGYDRDRVFVYEDEGSTINSLPKVLEKFTQKIKQLGLYSK
jgi:coenzyme F420-reducing hydrogenase delta subunit